MLKFPHQIVSSIKAVGHIQSNRSCDSHDVQTTYEIVIDNLNQPWRAKLGVLEWLGTTNNVPKYKDPRSVFHTVGYVKTGNGEPGLAWVNTETGEKVEERSVWDTDPLAWIPPDCRESWKNLI